MFIQVTKEKFMRKKDIIGIFDLDTSTVSGITKSFLNKAEKNKKITGITTLPKSFVLTGDKEKNEEIYFSANLSGHIGKAGL
jgi:hypothetical protein